MLDFRTMFRCARPNAKSVIAWCIGIVVLPLLILAVFEGGLRVAGVGRSTRYWVTKNVRDERFYLPNKSFYQQFYSLPIDGPQWSEFEFAVPVRKAGNVFRVFVLGESAAMGVPPDDAYAFWRILEAMLAARFPELRFEFYCVAMAGANSNVMRPAAMACARTGPDLFLVYMGNNEICGPLGPTSGLQYVGLWYRPMIRAAIWLSDLRLAQLLNDPSWERQSSIKAKPKRNFAEVGALAPSDLLVRRTWAIFRANLEDVCRAGLSADAAVVLCTVGSNLRHCAPTRSEHSESLSAEVLSDWKRYYAAGIDSQKMGRFDEALHRFNQAAAIDDTFAELQFRRGCCLWQLGEFAEARTAFHAARENDFWLVRAGDRVNSAIREVAAHMNEGVYLADAEARLTEASPNALPGAEYFYDNVHMTFEGNYLVASSAYEQIAALLQARLGRTGDAPPPPGEEICRERLALTPAVLAEHLQGFIQLYERKIEEEPTAEENLRILRQRQDRELAQLGTEQPALANLRAFGRALELNPFDYIIRYRYSNLLMGTGHPQEGMEQAGRLAAIFPCRRNARITLARTLLGAGRTAEAQSELESLVKLFPDDASAMYELSDLYREAGNFENAMAYFQKGVFLGPDDSRVHSRRAALLEAHGDIDAAITAYQEALHADGADPTLYSRLATLLLRRRRTEEALELLRSGTERFPGLPFLRFEWGKALESLGRRDEALTQFEEAIASGGLDNYRLAEAQSYLARIRGDSGSTTTTITTQ